MSHRCGEGVICCELINPSNTKFKINLHGILSTWLSRVECICIFGGDSLLGSLTNGKNYTNCEVPVNNETSLD